MNKQLNRLLAHSHNKLLPDCTAEDISSLELELGIQLPSDYRELLLAANGILFASLLMFEVREEYSSTYDDGREAVRVFASLGGENAVHSIRLLRTAYEFEERVPDWIVPVGDNGSGIVFICISCGERDYGRVYVWSPQQLWEEEENEQTYRYLYRAADSFTEFIDSLEESPDEA